MALSTESSALVILAISAFFFSVMETYIKLASDDVPSTQLVFIRACFQMVIVLLLMLVVKVEIPLPSEDCVSNNTDADVGEHESQNRSQHESSRSVAANRPLKIRRRMIFIPFGNREQRFIVISRGICGAFAFCCYFYALEELPIGDASTLFSLYPLFTVFLARCFLGERIVCLNLSAAFVSLIGAAYIAGPSYLTRHGNGNDADSGYGHNSSPNPLGHIAAFVGSFFGAAVMVLNRAAGKANVHMLQLIFSWAIFSTSLSLLFGQTLGREIEDKWHMPQFEETWRYIYAMMLIGTCAHFMLNYAGRLAPAGLGAITRSSGVMWSYMWEVTIFHQIPQWTTIFGVLMVLASLIIVAVATGNDEMSVASSSSSSAVSGSDQGGGIESASSSASGSASASGTGNASFGENLVEPESLPLLNAGGLHAQSLKSGTDSMSEVTSNYSSINVA